MLLDMYIVKYFLYDFILFKELLLYLFLTIIIIFIWYLLEVLLEVLTEKQLKKKLQKKPWLKKKPKPCECTCDKLDQLEKDPKVFSEKEVVFYTIATLIILKLGYNHRKNRTICAKKPKSINEFPLGSLYRPSSIVKFLKKYKKPNPCDKRLDKALLKLIKKLFGF